MWFLIKSAFWLSLLLFIIPMPKGPDGSAPAAGVSAIEAIGAAQVALRDMSGFCQRNPDACVVGQAALVSMGERAKVGAKWVYDTLDQTLPAQTTAQTPATGAPASHQIAAGAGLEIGTTGSIRRPTLVSAPIPQPRPLPRG